MIVENIIPVLFYILFFFVPLVLFPYTSELFEFNKMILVYILTTLIMAVWLYRCIVKKKFIFRRTILDIPLLIFLVSYLISTLLSIDFRTSLLGYYSRFHGGLTSYLCYSFLYWAYVSNMDRDKTTKVLSSALISTTLASVYGILEHFGIDKNIWVQDVVNRVFSTFGQPNWLAAWLVALLPLSWSNALTNFRKSKKFYLYLALSALFFLTLLFTKSRSGLFGFVIADVIFWGFILFKYKKEFLKEFLIHNSLFIILVLLVGTPWTPNISNKPTTVTGPALETGGTESGEIRKIVWKGAIEIWKHYPIFGTGPETFAYSYYSFRPVEHNLVSEWDFLYNKAHNEYLNYLANTGSVGFLTYIVLISFSIWQISKFKNLKHLLGQRVTTFGVEIRSISHLHIALLSGYVSILVSNFFGFSVVPTSLEFFLFPAMAIALGKTRKLATDKPFGKLDTKQKILLLIVGSCTLIVVSAIGRYWYADVLFAKGKQLNNQGKIVSGRETESKAVSLSPKEAIFWNELSQSDTDIALALFEQKEKDKVGQFTQLAIEESKTATSLSPRNLNLKRSQASLFIKLSEIDPNYLRNAKEVLINATVLAPTDAKIFYNLGLTEARLGETDKAISTLEKTVAMKPNYREARLTLAVLLTKNGQKEKAKDELLYILQKIDPNDSIAKQQLEELGR